MLHLYQPTIFFFIISYFYFITLQRSSHVLISWEEYQTMKLMEKLSPYLFIKEICCSAICFPICQKQNWCRELGKTILIASLIWASWSVTIAFGATPYMHLSHFLKIQTNISLYSSASNAQLNKIDCWWWLTPVNGAKDRFRWLVLYVV